ncbi:receptor-like protein EIX2 [Silene latifolia]|uniref:receptor-like protein EIX2 n=1 Tax=Silene latifolia TaxID=37657 RepID=UPI003D77B317
MREMHSLVLLLLITWLTIICCEAKSEIDNNNNNNKSKGIECTESERDALLEFKRGINVDRCGVLDSWGVSQDCCLWRGIQCHNLSGHVIALNLRTPQTPYDDGNQETCLDGTISVSILDLKHLKYLDLSYNRFQGQIPKFIGSLANLEYLNLSYAGFTGVIPREIGNLSRLTSLDLNYVHYYSDYNIRVESLWWLSQLTLLREVNLGGIDLSLTSNNWVSIVNNLPFLQVLRLDDCQLSLKLPLDSSLSYRSTNFSTTLGVISLRRNNLNDTSIFEWLYDLGRVKTNLFYLDLSDNQQLFKSDFQQTGLNILGNLCNLQTLELFNTGLNYSFSDIIQSLSICSYKSLMYLGLNSNQIWGSIPENISNLSYLKELYVENNELNGPISQALGKLSMLETLSLSFNPLKGVLTDAHLSNLSRLIILSLVFNTELVLNISANWVPPFQLDELYLRSCQVGPDFPIWLTTQKKLTIIDITNTSISDTIPVSFFTSLSPKLKALAMSRNMMYGILPNVSITFEASPLIDLSSNNFSGAIPLFLRNVSALRLNNNHFSKGLVPFLCPQTKMPLMYLHLANNAFSDKLPNCWGYFDKLLVLHLENNKLWGNLPISMGSLNQLNSLHLSSNNLSGELPESLLNCSSLIIP